MARLKRSYLPERIHDFLYENNPAFGYAAGHYGEENKEQWIQTLDVKLVEEDGEWLCSQINSGIENVRYKSDAEIGKKLVGYVSEFQSIKNEYGTSDPGKLYAILGERLEKQWSREAMDDVCDEINERKYGDLEINHAAEINEIRGVSAGEHGSANFADARFEAKLNAAVGAKLKSDDLKYGDIPILNVPEKQTENQQSPEVDRLN